VTVLNLAVASVLIPTTTMTAIPRALRNCCAMQPTAVPTGPDYVVNAASGNTGRRSDGRRSMRRPVAHRDLASTENPVDDNAGHVRQPVIPSLVPISQQFVI